MEWINVFENGKYNLPRDGQRVLILYDGEIKTACFERGIDEETRRKMKNGEIEEEYVGVWSLSSGYEMSKRSDFYRSCDVFGNNTVPFCWRVDGNTIFGQNVKKWQYLLT